MSLPGYTVRRATLDDIKPLSALWKSMQFPAPDLEKRVTEFQVVTSPDGKLLGALGFQIAERQGRLHSEAFTDFSLADTLRPLLWERIQSIATNHGLVRLWTQEQAPFWTHTGLVPASKEALQKLPPAWNNSHGNWLMVQLRDETAVAAISLDKEFAMFMESEKQRTEKAFQQARTLKVFATLIAVGLAIFVIVAAVYFLRRTHGVLFPQ